MKNYLLRILEHCSDEQFGQDAVEHAITTGFIRLSYNLGADLVLIMGAPNLCPTCNTLNCPGEATCTDCGFDLPALPKGRYDDICAHYRQVCAANEAALVQSYEHSGLLEEILRPVPLSKAA